MNFGQALYSLKSGAYVSREGWNGKGQYIGIQLPSANSDCTYPYIFIVPVQGGKVPWLASQTDLLANDWGVTGDQSPKRDGFPIQ